MKIRVNVVKTVTLLTCVWIVPGRTGRSGIESRWGRDFPPVQTGPGAHPASYKMGTASFPGVKCSRGVLLTTHPFYCRGHVRVKLYLYPPSGPHRACNGKTLPFIAFLSVSILLKFQFQTLCLIMSRTGRLSLVMQRTLWRLCLVYKLYIHLLKPLIKIATHLQRNRFPFHETIIRIFVNIYIYIRCTTRKNFPFVVNI